LLAQVIAHYIPPNVVQFGSPNSKNSALRYRPK